MTQGAGPAARMPRDGGREQPAGQRLCGRPWTDPAACACMPCIGTRLASCRRNAAPAGRAGQPYSGPCAASPCWRPHLPLLANGSNGERVGQRQPQSFPCPPGAPQAPARWHVRRHPASRRWTVRRCFPACWPAQHFPGHSRKLLAALRPHARGRLVRKFPSSTRKRMVSCGNLAVAAHGIPACRAVRPCAAVPVVAADELRPVMPISRLRMSRRGGSVGAAFRPQGFPLRAGCRARRACPAHTAAAAAMRRITPSP
jgi:hypothetical protein